MERKTKGFEEVQANGLVLLEAPVGLLNSFRDRFGELLEFDKKGLVLAPLNTDPGAGRGFPNGFVEPLLGVWVEMRLSMFTKCLVLLSRIVPILELGCSVADELTIGT